MKIPFLTHVPMKPGVIAILLGLTTLSAHSDDWGDDEETLEIERIFVVTADDKPATHPFYGVGHKRGMDVDGVPGKELVLTRGKNYAFRVDTDIKHDFYLSTEAVGWGASVLAEGVEGNFTYDGIVTIETTNKTPREFYYACCNHKYMGGKIHLVNAGEEDKVELGKIDISKLPPTKPPRPVSEHTVKQKISFADMFVSQSSAAKRVGNSDNDKAKVAYTDAHDRLNKAKIALEAGDLVLALEEVDESLRSMSTAARLVPTPEQLEEQKLKFAALMEEVKVFEESYKRNVERMEKSGRTDVRDHLSYAELESTIEAAESLRDMKEISAANRLMMNLQRTITTALGKILDNQTVVYDKTFESPQEEYEYELARYLSYEELVPLAIEQKRPSKRAIELMDQFVVKGKDIYQQSKPVAEQKDYKNAILMLQGATFQIQRALRMVGVR